MSDGSSNRVQCVDNAIPPESRGSQTSSKSTVQVLSPFIMQSDFLSFYFHRYYITFFINQETPTQTFVSEPPCQRQCNHVDKTAQVDQQSSQPCEDPCASVYGAVCVCPPPCVCSNADTVSTCIPAMQPAIFVCLYLIQHLCYGLWNIFTMFGVFTVRQTSPWSFCIRIRENRTAHLHGALYYAAWFADLNLSEIIICCMNFLFYTDW